MRIVGDDGLVIETIFPKEKYKDYLNTIRISEDELTTQLISKFFLLLRSDFLKGKLDLDEFSNICNRLWNIMVRKNIIEDDVELSEALNAGGELSFYIRKIKLLHLFNDFLTKVYEFEFSSSKKTN